MKRKQFVGNRMMIGKVMDFVDQANRPRQLSKLRPDHEPHQGSKEQRRRQKQLARQAEES